MPRTRPPTPASTGLTKAQRACLDAIEAHFARTRTMPTADELRAALGLSSKSGAFRLLRQLEERGRIARVPLRARAIRLLPGETCASCGERLAP